MTEREQPRLSSLKANLARIKIEPTAENIEKAIGPYVTPDMLPSEDELREKLKGKIAIITGSTKGIGAETAYLFGELGMKVVVNGRDQNRGQLIAAEIIRESHGEAIFVPADVSTPEGAQNLIKETVEQYGRIDIVVNNVGTKRDKLLVRMDENDWYDVMKTNADSTFFVTQAALKEMIRNKNPKGGKIIAVSSLGVLGIPGQAAYAASKSGMEALMRVAAAEWGSRDIYTSVLRLGLVDTELTADVVGKQREQLLEMLNSSNGLKPQEVAPAIAYLATVEDPGIMTQLTLKK